MQTKHSRCLLLNSDYNPLYIIDWKRAIIWNMKHQDNHRYGIDIVDFYKNDHIMGINNKKYPVPAVCKTKRFFKTNRNNVNFSRKNIFIRDSHTCQYCGQNFNSNELTYDHIIPKSKWKNINSSPTCWTNITTACIRCNRIKGDKTPKEANMPLITLPIIPSKSIKYLPIAHQLNKIKDQVPEEWKTYLPESYCL